MTKIKLYSDRNRNYSHVFIINTMSLSPYKKHSVQLQSRRIGATNKGHAHVGRRFVLRYGSPCLRHVDVPDATTRFTIRGQHVTQSNATSRALWP
jgi:hypothetical protein